MAGSGQHERLPRGLRNNNPGNLRHSGMRWQGLKAEQTDKEFCQFTTIVWGYRALAKTLLTYQRKYGLRTVTAIICRWAPQTENDTESYIRAVCRITGFKPMERLNLEKAGVLKAVAGAISQHENGRAVCERDVAAGVKLALEGDSHSATLP